MGTSMSHRSAPPHLPDRLGRLLSRTNARALVALPVLAALGCVGTEGAKTPEKPPAKLAEAFVEALDAEVNDPIAAGKYLDAVDKAIANGRDPESLATIVGALDALVYRDVEAIGISGTQAIAYRSRDVMPVVVDRLRAAWTRAGEALEEG